MLMCFEFWHQHESSPTRRRDLPPTLTEKTCWGKTFEILKDGALAASTAFDLSGFFSA